MASSRTHRWHGSIWSAPCKSTPRQCRLTSSRLERSALLPSGTNLEEGRPAAQATAVEQGVYNEKASRRRSSKPNAQESSAQVTPAQLSADIRACYSPSQLLALYRRLGTSFDSTHATDALHRLADVAPNAHTPPDSGSGDRGSPPSSSNSDSSGRWSPQRWGADTQPYVQQTGRLIVRQGKDATAHPPSPPPGPTNSPFPHSSEAADDDRRSSHHVASTSAPDPHTQGSPSQQPHHAGRHRKRRNLSNYYANDSGGGAGPSGGANRGSGASRRQLVQMASGLVAVLTHGCQELDGAGVAAAAQALSRLRYKDERLLEQLEQRFIELECQRQRWLGQQHGQTRQRTHEEWQQQAAQQEGWREQQQQQELRGAWEQGRGLAGGAVGTLVAGVQGDVAVGVSDPWSAAPWRQSEQAAYAQVAALVAAEVQGQGVAAARTEQAPAGQVGWSPTAQEQALTVGASQAGSASGDRLRPSTSSQPAAALSSAVATAEPRRTVLQQGIAVAADTAGPARGASATGPRSRQTELGGSAPAEPGMSLIDLHDMVSSFGVLGHRPSQAWLRCVESRTGPALAAYAAHGGRLPLLLRYLAATGSQPTDDWLQAACAATRPYLASYSGGSLFSMVGGLSVLGHRPDEGWTADFMAASEAHLAGRKPWELTALISALAAVGCSPDDRWLQQFYQSSLMTVGTVGGMTGSQAAIVLSSLSRLDCRPSPDYINSLLVGTRRSLVDASAQQMTDLLAALARLRFRPPEPWLQQYYAASFQRLSFHTPQQCCATVTSLARLNRRPRPLWLEEMGRQLGNKLALLSAGQQSQAVAALADLGFAPSEEWLAGYEVTSNARLAECSAAELCRALAALVKLGFKPNASWLYSFIMAAYAQLDAFDAPQLALVFDRLPALAPHGSWLDEIIQICAAESSMRSQASAQAASAQRAEAGLAEDVGGPDLALAEQLEAQQQQQLSVAAAAAVEWHGMRPLAGCEQEEGPTDQVASVEAVDVSERVLGPEALPLQQAQERRAVLEPAASIQLAAGASTILGLQSPAVQEELTGQELMAAVKDSAVGPPAPPALVQQVVVAGVDAQAQGEPTAGISRDVGPVAVTADQARPWLAVAGGPVAAAPPSTAEAAVGAEVVAAAAAAAAAALGFDPVAVDACGPAPTSAAFTELPVVASSNTAVPELSALAASAVGMDESLAADASQAAAANISVNAAATAVVLAAASDNSLARDGATIAIPPELVPLDGGVVSTGAPCSFASEEEVVAGMAFGGGDVSGLIRAANGVVLCGAEGETLSLLQPADLITVSAASAAAAAAAVNGSAVEGTTAVNGVVVPGPLLQGNGDDGEQPLCASGAAGRRNDKDTDNSGGSNGGGGGSGGTGTGRSIAFPTLTGAREGQIAVLPKPQRARVPAAAVAAVAASVSPASGSLDGRPAGAAATSGEQSGISFPSSSSAVGAPDGTATLHPSRRPPPQPVSPAAAAMAGATTVTPAAPGPAAPAAAAQRPIKLPDGAAPGAAAAMEGAGYGSGNGPSGLPTDSSQSARAAAAAGPPTSGPNATDADLPVQYLDSVSLHKLIGMSDGPPGPDFSGCQKRAAAARGARTGPYGIFQLGRVWTTEGGEGGVAGGGCDGLGGGGGAAGQPLPSPAG